MSQRRVQMMRLALNLKWCWWWWWISVSDWSVMNRLGILWLMMMMMMVMIHSCSHCPMINHGCEWTIWLYRSVAYYGTHDQCFCVWWWWWYYLQMVWWWWLTICWTCIVWYLLQICGWMLLMYHDHRLNCDTIPTSPSDATIGRRVPMLVNQCWYCCCYCSNKWISDTIL